MRNATQGYGGDMNMVSIEAFGSTTCHLSLQEVRYVATNISVSVGIILVSVCYCTSCYVIISLDWIGILYPYSCHYACYWVFVSNESGLKLNLFEFAFINKLFTRIEA